MSVLVTGGAGYIGSHTCVELLEAGYDIIVIDHFQQSNIQSLNHVKQLTNKEFKIYHIDLINKDHLETVFLENSIDAVIHFASLKSVGESVHFPLKYYQNNIVGTLNLIALMQQYYVKKLVFSSSATVYGNSQEVPIKENAALQTINPYGRTKLIIEEMLRDIYTSDNSWSITILRYFNPIGAHESGLIGEHTDGIPNNLMPYITQVAIGKRKELRIFGSDYPTKDGTGIRDYLHVMDLANGHVKSLNKMKDSKGVFTYNLGTGKGYSVLEIIQVFEKATGVKIPYRIVERRHGDSAVCYADPSKALKDLEWAAKRDIFDMCVDAWRWEKNLNASKV